MRPEEAPGAGVGGGRLSTAYPQIRAGGAKGAPSDPSASSSCDSRTAELPSRGGHRESPHCRFGAGVGGAALSGHPGPGGLRGAGSRAWPVLPPARPVWAAFGTVRQGLGGQLGPLPVSLSRGLLLVFILLAVPTCLAHRLPDSVFTAEETLQVPASASPRDPAGCVVQAGPSVSAWLTRPLRARPVLGHLFRSSSWTHRLSGLRTGLLCGGLASPPPLSRWGVQGPGGKVAGPGSLLGSWSLSQGTGSGPGLHETGLA